MWGRIRRRVVIYTWCMSFSVWFWVILVRSIWEGQFYWPFDTGPEIRVVVLFTLLFLISVWELEYEDDE